MDRMGDLVLSLPCDQILEDTYEICWLVPEDLDFIVQSAQPKRFFKTSPRKWSLRNFRNLVSTIREIKPDIAISFHAPWWVHFALFFAGVRIRGGVLSQWHSWLFLNKTLRQKRSRCELHEMEYNFQLTEYVFNRKTQKQKWKPVELECSPIHDSPLDIQGDYFVVHPGMGGSALNWPNSHYRELLERLTERVTVIVTGTEQDETWLEPLKSSLKKNPGIVWMDKKLGGPQLLSLLKKSRANIAPSTGVLHLSASLGAVSIGIYSPVKVHRDLRWGARGVQVTTFSPSVDCPAHFQCLGKQCPHYFCMEKISVDSVVEKAFQCL